jgi:hypothetical protein
LNESVLDEVLSNLRFTWAGQQNMLNGLSDANLIQKKGGVIHGCYLSNDCPGHLRPVIDSLGVRKKLEQEKRKARLQAKSRRMKLSRERRTHHINLCEVKGSCPLNHLDQILPSAEELFGNTAEITDFSGEALVKDEAYDTCEGYEDVSPPTIIQPKKLTMILDWTLHSLEEKSLQSLIHGTKQCHISIKIAYF